MSLKREISSLEDVAENLRSLYVQKDGKYVLDLDGDGGADPGKMKAALDKERRDREALQKTLNDLKSKLGDTDPAKAREALQQLQELEEKALIGDLPPNIQAAVDKIVEARVQRQSAEFKTREDSLNGENGTLKTKLEELLIDNAIRSEAVKAKVVGTAVEDAVLLGKATFKLNKEGVPVPMEADGKTIRYSAKDATKPMSMEEWLADRAKDRAHWFEPSGGGGAQTPGKGPTSSGKVMTISKEEAKDPNAYRAAKDAAQKAGQSLQIAS
jgi:hypothetical protein